MKRIGINGGAALCGLAIVAMATIHSASDERRTEGPTLRVLTYNIHHGEGMDGKIDLARQAKVIKELKPELVALQEVDRETKRSKLVDQAAKLGELTGMKHVFGKAMDFDGGGYGEAILSAHPILETKTHALPAEKDHEPRALIEATIQVGKDGPKVRFFGTHLCHESADERMNQLLAIQKVVGDDAKSLMILASDLNDKPNSDTLKFLRKSWNDATDKRDFFTYPSDKPDRQLDYILYRPERRFRVVESFVVEEKIASDHCPVVAVFEILPE